MGRACNMNREKRNVYRLFIVGKARRKEATKKTKMWAVENIKMHLEEMGLVGVAWTDPAPYREKCKALVKMIMNLQVPYYAQKFLSDDDDDDDADDDDDDDE
jgi:hypothetical protein